MKHTPQSLNPRAVAPAEPPLQAIVGEAQDLVHALQAGVVQGDGAALHAAAQSLHVQLFLAASQLLPLWRDHSRDGAAVDRAEVRLTQLRELVDQVLDAGPQDVMQGARCAVLAEDLWAQLQRSQAAMAALDAALHRDAQQALAAVWKSETRRLEQAWRSGQPPVLDNEDADPVGQPPR